MVLCLLGSYKANNSERRLAVQSARTACSQTELGRYHFCYYCFLIFAASQSLAMKNKESNTRLAKIVLPFTYLSSDSDPQFSSNYKWLPNFFVRSKENGISMKKYNNYDWRIEKIIRFHIILTVLVVLKSKIGFLTLELQEQFGSPYCPLYFKVTSYSLSN